jgi:hypothetical protein
MIRLTIANSSWAWSAKAAHNFGSICHSIWTRPPSVWASRSETASFSASIVTGCGSSFWRRAKASSR